MAPLPLTDWPSIIFGLGLCPFLLCYNGETCDDTHLVRIGTDISQRPTRDTTAPVHSNLGFGLPIDTDWLLGWTPSLPVPTTQSFCAQTNCRTTKIQTLITKTGWAPAIIFHWPVHSNFYFQESHDRLIGHLGWAPRNISHWPLRFWRLIN